MLSRQQLAAALLASLLAPALFLGGCASGTSSATAGTSSGTPWVWQGGSATVGPNKGQPGVYGTLGSGSATNIPSGRFGAASWTDNSGNFWLFGGQSATALGTYAYNNDLWEYNPGNAQWTWVSGTNPATSTPAGSYGTLGVAAASNVPPPRVNAVTWKDSSGNLWLFGGSTPVPETYGISCSTATSNYELPLNDLWEFSPSTGLWTWQAGSSTPNQVAGVYGTQGTPSATTTPGARNFPTAWTDPSGNFWLFGGASGLTTYATNSTTCVTTTTNTTYNLNDLWEYKPTTRQWTWVKGSSISGTSVTPANVTPTYGTQGTAAAANTPGARYGGSGWADSSGNLWLYGGQGFVSYTSPYSTSVTTPSSLNDMWEFSTSTGQWTWLGGISSATYPQTGYPQATYGTLGQAAAANTPGGRLQSTTWVDATGNFWLLGGSNQTLASPNDLWEYTPSTGLWTWQGGSSNTPAPAGNYGTLGSSSQGNVVGGRLQANGWTDSSGKLWLFGGFGLDSTGATGALNDLWSNPQ